MQTQKEAAEKRGTSLFVAVRPCVRALFVIAASCFFLGLIPALFSIVLVVGSTVLLNVLTWAALIVAVAGFALAFIGAWFDEDSVDAESARSFIRLGLLAVVIVIMSLLMINLFRPWKIEISDPDVLGVRTVELYSTNFTNTEITTYAVVPYSIVAHKMESGYGRERDAAERSLLEREASTK